MGALALGATVFEKHFTDNNNREGPDHKFAMNPNSWEEMVKRSNELYLSMGNGVKIVEKNEKESIGVQRRSIRASSEIKSGEILTEDKLEFLRPIGKNDLEPYRLNEILGNKVRVDIQKGESIKLKNLLI